MQARGEGATGLGSDRRAQVGWVWGRTNIPRAGKRGRDPRERGGCAEARGAEVCVPGEGN